MEAAEICKRFEVLHTDKANWEEHWDDVYTHTIPRKADIWTPRDQNSGEKRAQRIVDGTAVEAAEKLAAGLHSMLTNPATRWFELTTGRPDLDKRDDVRLWLQKCTDEMYYSIDNSNFYTEIHEYYMDQATIGSSVLLMLPDKETDIIFHSLSIADVEVDENSKGFIDTEMRKIRWTARQIVQEFGKENVPEEILKELIEGGTVRKFDIIHAVYPIADERGADKKSLSARGFKFVSKYVLVELKKTISTGGFKTNPFMVVRWTKLTGEKFGRGPGMKTLPDVKMINSIMQTTVRAAQKMVDPPMQVPDDGSYYPTKISPGGINYYRPGSKDRIETMDIKARPDFGVEFLDRLEVKIKEGFFNNLLSLTRDPQMTATEVMQRIEEGLRLMGPILGRQKSEFLTPMVDILFNTLLEKKRFPPAPDILKTHNKVTGKYSSMIARAQKTSQVEVIQRAMASIGPIAALDPSVMDNFDLDFLTNLIAQLYGLNEEIMREEGAIKKMRADRQQKIAAEEEALKNQQDADTYSKVGGVEAQIGDRG